MFNNKILKMFFGKKTLTVNDPDPLMTDHDLLALAVKKINELKKEIENLKKGK